MRKNIGLFRGKCAGQWLYGYLTINGNGTCQIWENTDVGFFPAVVNPKTVSEYTGLTDKNGVKIFEGDVIRYIPKYGAPIIGVVVCGDYSYPPENMRFHRGYYIKWTSEPSPRQELGFWTMKRKIEVIGNIHDNPELLGGDDNAAD